ncbi:MULTISPECIES: hypothetical protein [unclassified Nocardia]|uniref:TY-Chap domain-containing protein n=1 Tax=unclassified Nocardia TaxID=2637762 RepID=UPI00278C022D|nr:MULTISPECIES: hypothetical protein [unclassified Nocardia]
MTGWAEFTDQLASQLARMPDGVIITLSGAGRSVRYVQAQVLQLEDRIWAEFQGDAKLDDAAALNPSLMSETGWQLPDRDHHGNWWVEVPWPASSSIYRQLASMIVTGFRDHHHVPDATALTYFAWNDETGEPFVELPLLGIPSRDRL